MLRGRSALRIAGWLALASGAWAADSLLVVDRGLPAANLNNVSGSARSNVRWASGDSGFLGDHFTLGVRGSSGHDLTPVASTLLTPGSEESSNPNVRLTEATHTGTPLYDNFGKFLRVWQIDFTGLNIAVDGGANYNFGVWGMGREIPGGDGKGYMWFNHASNAPLSAARQDGADGVMLLFDGSGKAAGEFTGQGNGWDKNSDINVQVFAHRLSVRQTAAQ